MEGVAGARFCRFFRPGLVTSEKNGRVRTCRIDPAMLSAAERWVAERRALWERRLDRLGAFLDETIPKDEK